MNISRRGDRSRRNSDVLSDIDIDSKLRSELDSENDINLKDRNTSISKIINSGNAEVDIEVKVDSDTRARVRSRSESDQEQEIED